MLEILDFIETKIKVVEYEINNLEPQFNLEEMRKKQDEHYKLICIYNFVRMVNENQIDKRFLEFMFSDNLSARCDMTKLTRAILDLVQSARKLFPKEVKR